MSISISIGISISISISVSISISMSIGISTSTSTSISISINTNINISIKRNKEESIKQHRADSEIQNLLNGRKSPDPPPQISQKHYIIRPKKKRSRVPPQVSHNCNAAGQI